MCLAGAVVVFWSLKQEVAGSSPFTVMANIFVTEFAEISENVLGKLNWPENLFVVTSEVNC